jgi:hypothetical protein
LAIRALAHFHWDAGARVALRANAIIIAIVVFTLGSAPDGLATLRRFLLGIVGQRHPVGSRALLAAVCLVLAATGVPRTTLGLGGWVRSLPIRARDVRRATVLALCVAQLAILIFVPLAAIFSVIAYHATPSATKLLTVPVMMLAASMIVLPVRQPAARVFAAVALIGSVQAGWIGAAIALVAIWASDRVAGEVVPPRSRRRLWRATTPRHLMRGADSGGAAPMRWGSWVALVSWIRLSWRALGLRHLLDSMLVPVVFVGFAHLMVRNNPDFAPITVERIVRVCGVLALAFSTGTLANGLLRARQPWSWARSLPWSAAQRVMADACVLGAPLLVVPLALVPLAGVAAATVAALIPASALLGASALRVGAPRQTGAAGETVVMFGVIAVPVILWPVLTLAALAIVPAILALAARRERAARASRWTELQHAATGDPAWLSG